MRPIDIFHIGPQKSGTTWLYENLKQHPEIAVPKRDTIHYFDINYTHGEEWLEDHFENIGDIQKIFDPTFTYIRSPLALGRMHRNNPKARIALTLRNPLDRAYSHYWHEFKKDTIRYPFEAVLTNYDLFQNWIEPGLPIQAIKELYEYFGRDQVHIMMYEDLRQRPQELLKELFDFYGVDNEFVPSAADKIINAAGGKRNSVSRAKDKAARSLKLDRTAPKIYDKLSGRNEYKKGMDAAFRVELTALIAPMIQELADLSGKDLSHWLE